MIALGIDHGTICLKFFDMLENIYG